jgi:transposase
MITWARITWFGRSTDTLALEKLGFVVPGSDGGLGQPPYHPGDLLKLYLYGYLQRVRSSRALEREAARNLEVIWLIRGLRPRYRTIADFRKDNWAALKAVNREFVVLARKLDLIGGDVVAIDGAFFDGNAGKGSIKTRRKIEAHLAAINAEIEAYGASLEANDAAEAAPAADREAWEPASRPRAARRERRDAAVADRCGCPHFVEEGPGGCRLQRPDRGR